MLCAIAYRCRCLLLKELPDTLPLVLVISLARRPAKRASMMKRAQEADLKVKVLEAVDGRDLSSDVLAGRGVCPYAGWRLVSSAQRFFNRELKWGEVGCALSHYSAWEFARQLDRPVIVLEDDADFAPFFGARVQAALAELRTLANAGAIAPPDLLYLGRNALHAKREEMVPRSGVDHVAGILTPTLLRPAFSWKTTAYVLWPSGAAKLLSSGYLERLIPVDDFFGLLYDKHDAGPGMARVDLDELFAHAPRLTAYAVRPMLCFERRGLSDTENTDQIALSL